MKPKKTSSQGQQTVVMGRNCVQELMRAQPKRLHKVFLAPRSSGLEDLVKRLKELKVPIQEASTHELRAMVSSDSHQGVVALVAPKQKLDLKSFLAGANSQNSMVVLLDGVTDPHNLGSILRACECFGVDAVIWSHNRSSGITPVVSKTSVGASELVPYIEVANAADAVRKCKQHGYWVVASDTSAQAISLYDFQFREMTLLILGSEGGGISRLLLDLSDLIIKIPLSGQIESLNVSQAAAVLLSHYRHGLP